MSKIWDEKKSLRIKKKVKRLCDKADKIPAVRNKYPQGLFKAVNEELLAKRKSPQG